MATTARGNAVHALVGGTLASPTTAAQRALLQALITRGVVTPAGSYAAGKSQTDVERVIQVPEILSDALDRQLRVMGI